ncbi:MAG: hypothetical protein R2855_12310 [Thermomicrobiales bacterium]
MTYSPGGHSLGSPASLSIERDRRFRIDTAQIEATPRGSVALVMTPNDPTGNAISHNGRSARTTVQSLDPG